MKKLEGTVFTNGDIKGMKTVVIDRSDLTYVQELELALIEVCKQLIIPIPIWLDKNTKEFARFRQTFFFAEQFLESVYFDQLQIKLLKEE